jgi:hypothetical protein
LTRRLRAPHLLLAAALTTSLYLKAALPGLDLAHYAGPDEGEVVENVLEMLKTGHLHQRHPGYPGLHFYLQMVPAAARYGIARLSGEASSLAGVAREDFYWLARWMTLLTGSLAALGVWVVTRREYGEGPASVAGAVIALSPLAFRVSRWVSPDLMLSLFALGSLGLSLSLRRTMTWMRFTLAGLSVGAATAIKYTGALLAVPFALAWLGSGKARRTAGRAAWGALSAGAGFCLLSPYSLIDWQGTWFGLSQHVAYYQAQGDGGAAQLAYWLLWEGLGLSAALVALSGAVVGLLRREVSVTVVLGFIASYVLLFSLFQRAYSRHAVVLLPAIGLLVARGFVAWASGGKKRAALVATVVLLPPLGASLRLGLAARQPTPAERAREWIEENVPSGSRVLADQMTPRLDGRRYRFDRMQVEEEIFSGNYDWVLHSGYPPGLRLTGLRRVARFESRGSLTPAVTLYQVPSREALMGLSITDGGLARLGAGEPEYFGEGWERAEATTWGTSVRSRGPMSEIFFVARSGAPLWAELYWAVAARAPVEVEARLALNGLPLNTLRIAAEEPSRQGVLLPEGVVRAGLNRLVLEYPKTHRVDRRRREGAVRLYELTLAPLPTPSR